MIDSIRFEISLRHLAVPMALVLVGVAFSISGLLLAPGQTWPAQLLNGFYITSLSASALFFLASQRLTGARWSAGLRRIPEALMLALPVAALLMLALFFGREWIYPWTRPDAFSNTPAIAGKVRYLQIPWVFGRMAVTLFLWTAFAWLFRRTSLHQDRNPHASLACHHRLNRYAAAFVVVFAISFTLGAYDWLISLEPEWFSTMFAVYLFAGTFVQGIAAVTLAAVLLRERGLLRDTGGEQPFQYLGEMLFAFTTFWAYLWTCQYLLIWYANLPEEITHYVKRTNGSWVFLFALNFLVNWIVPFVGLLSRRAKSNLRILKAISMVILGGRWLDLYVLIMPAFGNGPGNGIIAIPIALGHFALLYLIFLRSLVSTSLVPLHDPLLEGSPGHGM